MRRAALLGALVAVIAGPATAQEVSVLVGGVQARYADSVSGTAGLLSLRLGGSSPNVAGVIDAGFSKFASGEWVSQASSYGTAVLGVGRAVNLGLAAGGDLNYTEGGLWSSEASAGPLIAISSGTFFATLGASLGVVRSIADSSFGMTTVTGRLRQDFPGGFAVSGGVLWVAADTVTYADATLEVAHSGPRTRLSALGGIRTGDLFDDPWGQVQVKFSVTPRTTIEAAAGRYPTDLAGFTDGLFATIGIRLGLTRPTRRLAGATPPVMVEPLEPGRVRVTFSFPGTAQRLEIAGDWNGWLSLPLERRGRGTWSVELALLPGIHRYSLIVDGETWTVPDGVATQPDDFGGRVALLVVRY